MSVQQFTTDSYRHSSHPNLLSHTNASTMNNFDDDRIGGNHRSFTNHHTIGGIQPTTPPVIERMLRIDRRKYQSESYCSILTEMTLPSIKYIGHTITLYPGQYATVIYSTNGIPHLRLPDGNILDARSVPRELLDNGMFVLIVDTHTHQV